MSPATPFQPIIPEQPKQVSEAEFNFMEDSPPEFFPDNPESNFGLKRRLWTTQMQEIIDQLNLTYLERFPTTSTQFIDEWEITVGLPVGTDTSEAGIAARRNRVVSRLRKSAFTDELIRQVVEGFIAVTFGAPLMLTVPGVEIPAGGLTLYGEGGDISATYRVYHDLQNFSYTVYIRSDITPDIVSLTRELTRITPAGISFTIDNSKANILDYQRTILDDGPSGYWPLATSSGTGAPWQSIAGISNVGVMSGSPTNVGALIQNGGGVVGDTQGRRFDGVDDAVTFPALVQYSGIFSWEVWIKPLSLTPALSIFMSAGLPYLGVYSDGSLVFSIHFDGSQRTMGAAAAATGAVVIGQIYQLVGTWDGRTMRLYKNGVEVASQVEIGESLSTYGPVVIGSHSGGSYWYNGDIDEPAIYNYVLSPEQILKHYKTGKNLT